MFSLSGRPRSVHMPPRNTAPLAVPWIFFMEMKQALDSCFVVFSSLYSLSDFVTYIFIDIFSIFVIHEPGEWHWCEPWTREENLTAQETYVCWPYTDTRDSVPNRSPMQFQQNMFWIASERIKGFYWSKISLSVGQPGEFTSVCNNAASGSE